MNTLTISNYFDFERDFVEDNVRCIPMIVRFKLDVCGIKLKLAEWSRMVSSEREDLAERACNTPNEIERYRHHLITLIRRRTGNIATELPYVENPVWEVTDDIPLPIHEKLKEFSWDISLRQWRQLTTLQRFALLKLSYPGHENKNFPRAMKEFQLIG